MKDVIPTFAEMIPMSGINNYFILSYQMFSIISYFSLLPFCQFPEEPQPHWRRRRCWVSLQASPSIWEVVYNPWILSSRLWLSRPQNPILHNITHRQYQHYLLLQLCSRWVGKHYLLRWKLFQLFRSSTIPLSHIDTLKVPNAYEVHFYPTRSQERRKWEDWRKGSVAQLYLLYDGPVVSSTSLVVHDEDSLCALPSCFLVLVRPPPIIRHLNSIEYF